MRNIATLGITLSALVLTACGGAGFSSGTTSTGTGGANSSAPTDSSASSTTVATLKLATNTTAIGSDATGTATITAVALDGNNNTLADIPVSFSANGGAVTVVQGTTDTTGVASATLTTGGTPQNGVITVTATAGTAQASVTVTVSGTTLSVSGPSSLVQSAQQTYNVALTDSGGNPIQNQTVTLTSANGNKLPATVTTSSTGQASFSYTATNSGTDTITATTPYASTPATQQVSISSQNLNIASPSANATFSVNSPQPVNVNWSNQTASVTSGTIHFATSRGTITAVNPEPNDITTAAVSNGGASATLTSPTAGPAIITVTALDSNGTAVASTQVAVNFVAPLTANSKIAIQANPSVVAPQSKSNVTATVTDAAGNPVSGAGVDFTLAADPTGGSLSANSLQTNPQGQAQVQFIAGATTSAASGVQITASLANYSNISQTTTLTVGGQTTFLSLGTSNLITPFSSTQYQLPFSVQAVDAAGNGLPNVNITFTVQPLAYAMGALVWNGTLWLPSYATSSKDSLAVTLAGTSGCQPTRVDEVTGLIYPSGTLPSGAVPVSTAIPGSVAATDVGSAVTGAAGSAAFNLIYPKQYANWAAVAVTASATVSGSDQSTTTMALWLPGLTSDYSSQNASPPGPTSAFNPITYVAPPTQLSCYQLQ